MKPTTRLSTGMTRREGLARVVAQAVGARRPRLVPRDQLVNVLEYEEQAVRALAQAASTLIADRVDAAGDRMDRAAFDRITLRPRMLVPALDLDLGVTLFGDALHAPILVAPIADQKRFHRDGETATVQGATLAKAPVIVSSQSSIPLATLAKDAATPIWAQVFATDGAARQQIQAAADAGCRAVCLTVGVKPATGSAGAPSAVRVDWSAVGALVSASRLPVIVKGVATVADAKAALQQNARGIVVSNYGGATTRTAGPLILDLPAIVDAVGGQVPVLVDGGFRRGTDVLKALAFGAQGVLVGRPVMWGLGAYGAEGVRGVIEMLQTELGRYMAMCGKPRVELLRRDVLRVHGIAASTSTVSG